MGSEKIKFNDFELPLVASPTRKLHELGTERPSYIYPRQTLNTLVPAESWLFAMLKYSSFSEELLNSATSKRDNGTVDDAEWIHQKMFFYWIKFEFFLEMRGKHQKNKCMEKYPATLDGKQRASESNYLPMLSFWWRWMMSDANTPHIRARSHRDENLRWLTIHFSRSANIKRKIIIVSFKFSSHSLSLSIFGDEMK